MAGPSDNGPRRYLIFDIEAFADGDLVPRIRYPRGESLSPQDAIAKYRQQTLADARRQGHSADDVHAADLRRRRQGRRAVLSADRSRRARRAAFARTSSRNFWQGWTHYGRPTLVTFNGRGYDLPVLELAAFRYGLSVPAWFNVEAPVVRAVAQPLQPEAHLDLMDLFSNFGAARLSGGLNLLANLIGKPGKTGIDGSKVQDMYDAGKVGRDQRLLPLRRARHVLRLSAVARAARQTEAGRGAGDRRRNESLARRAGRVDPAYATTSTIGATGRRRRGGPATHSIARFAIRVPRI